MRVRILVAESYTLDTWFDFRYDVGAEAFNMPYRWRPLDWKVGGSTYINERAISTQQTGFTLRPPFYSHF